MKKTQEILRIIARTIDDFLKETLGEKFGFVIIIYEFKKPDIVNYISDSNRDDMIKALRETADRLEKNKDMPAIIG